MNQSAIYLDNHSTTPVDPRVVEAMLPFFTEHFGNAASITHRFGETAREAVQQARETIASAINARPHEIIFTSGATESNCQAIYGIAHHPRARGKHLVSVTTEHKAILDPLAKLARQGFETTLLNVKSFTQADCGLIDLNQLRDALREDTILVSVMLANNEIGVIQPLAEIGAICREQGVPLHSDAAQALGKIPIDVQQLNVALLSLTAHKIHGPKGIGAIYVRDIFPRVKLLSLIDGGGHERGLRSGTLNVPAIVGFAKAVELALSEREAQQSAIGQLRDHLFQKLSEGVSGVDLNGPELRQGLRLAGNLNCRFHLVDGQALAMKMESIAVSTGSACTSANPEPSHVLRAIGLSDDQSHSSLRFGLSRFNDLQQIESAAARVIEAVHELRKMSSMA